MPDYMIFPIVLITYFVGYFLYVIFLKDDLQALFWPIIIPVTVVFIVGGWIWLKLHGK